MKISHCQGFFSKNSNYSAIFKMPLYLVLKGSKKNFGAFGAEKHPLYPIFCVFIVFLGHFFSKNRQNFLKMAPQAKIFKNFTQTGHIWCLKRLQNVVKIGKNFKIPLYLVLRCFKTPLYLVLSGSQKQ